MITTDELNRLHTVLDRLPAVIDDVRRIVRGERISRGMSVRAAAADMGVPPTTLDRFERGRGTPHVNTLLSIYQWLTTLAGAARERD